MNHQLCQSLPLFCREEREILINKIGCSILAFVVEQVTLSEVVIIANDSLKFAIASDLNLGRAYIALLQGSTSVS